MKLTQRLAIRYVQTKFKLLRIISKRRTAEKAFDVFATPYLKSVRKFPVKNAVVVELRLNNKKVNGYRWNHPQPKKALILHGFGSAAHKFEDYAELLASKGFEVLAFDAPAHGESEGTRTNAIEYCEMIKLVVQQYGPVESFFAHSFGGISLCLALETIPHDAGTKVVFIAPATETTSAVDGAFGMLKLNDERVRSEFDKIVFEVSGRKTEWFSIRRAMQNIKASVLWIHDEDDDITPWADALKVKEDDHPNIEFVLTKGLGHRKIYHDRAVKEQVIKFM
ncbi:MAG: alpha/beta fold hydrolase [Chitinophagaceae bacterium]|nr:alpha/beta fold hydrolase [Chitinophagaceae bacterium]